MFYTVAEVRSANTDRGGVCPDTPDVTPQFAKHQLPSHPSALVSIPISLVHAFRGAVQAVEDLQKHRPETVLLYKGKPVAIRYVIELASIFDDHMPDDVYERLCELTGEEPQGLTFSAGAQCLRRMYGDLRITQRARVRSAQQRALGESQHWAGRLISRLRRSSLVRSKIVTAT
jgi:hypothetical protein